MTQPGQQQVTPHVVMSQNVLRRLEEMALKSIPDPEWGVEDNIVWSEQSRDAIEKRGILRKSIVLAMFGEVSMFDENEPTHISLRETERGEKIYGVALSTGQLALCTEVAFENIVIMEAKGHKIINEDGVVKPVVAIISIVADGEDFSSLITPNEDATPSSPPED